MPRGPLEHKAQLASKAFLEPLEPLELQVLLVLKAFRGLLARPGRLAKLEPLAR